MHNITMIIVLHSTDAHDGISCGNPGFKSWRSINDMHAQQVIPLKFCDYILLKYARFVKHAIPVKDWTYTGEVIYEIEH